MIDFIKNTIGFYTIAATVGLLLTWFVYLRLGRRRNETWQRLIVSFLFACAGLLIGAHLLFFIVGLPDWIAAYSGRLGTVNEFISAVAQGASGLVFYGGLFGAYAGLLIFCRINKLDCHFELDHATVVFPLFHFFGRIGCTLEGCCYGIEYHGLFAIHYTEEYIAPGISDDIADFPRFPIQPLEALLELAIFFLLLYIYKKSGDKYSLTSIYLLLYSVIRFSDEFLRGDSARKIWGPFSTSQWISLAAFICVMVFLIIKQRRSPSKKFFAYYSA